MCISIMRVSFRILQRNIRFVFCSLVVTHRILHVFRTIWVYSWRSIMRTWTVVFQSAHTRMRLTNERKEEKKHSHTTHKWISWLRCVILSYRYRLTLHILQCDIRPRLVIFFFLCRFMFYFVSKLARMFQTLIYNLNYLAWISL